MNQNIKVGDRVTIIATRYYADPSRGAGGKGTVHSINKDNVWVIVDDTPKGDPSAWPFQAYDLRVDDSFGSTKFYRVGEVETHGLGEALVEAFNMSKDMNHPVQVYRIGDNELMATIIAER